MSRYTRYEIAIFLGNSGRDYNSHMNKKNAKICVLEKGIGG